MGNYLVCGKRENNSKTVSNIMADFITDEVGPSNDTSGNGWALRTEDFANLIIAISDVIDDTKYIDSNSLDENPQDEPTWNINALKEIMDDFAFTLADMIVREERYTYVRWE